MAPKAPAHTTQTTEVKLPAWVDAASQKNYAQAEKIAGQKYRPYTGKRLADQSAMTTRGYDLLNKNVGIADQDYAKATGLLDRASGDLDIQKYLNPYTAEVEKNALSAVDRQRQQSIMQGSDTAASSGAFGGSRHGLTAAVTNTEAAREAGDLSARLRAQGFDTATANAFADMARMRDTAGAYQGLGQQKQTSGMADVGSLLGAGEQEQGYRQKQIDVAREKWDEPRNFQIDNLNLLLSSLGMSPYGKSESMERTGTSEEKGPDWATTGLGVLQLLPTLLPMLGLSDKTMKTDITKVGRDPTTGLSMYSFRYKGDPKSYPKVVGPMAQDVQKKYPGHVAEIGGKLAISPAIMAATKIAQGA
jgi:hypothetical protein